MKVGGITGKLMPVCGRASDVVGNRGCACCAADVDRAICSGGGGVIVIIAPGV